MDQSAGTTRIVLYAPHYAASLLEAIPYTRYLWERGLCYLGDLRDENAHLIIITPGPVDSSVVEYHFRDLYRFTDEQIRSATDRLTFLSPRNDSAQPLDVAVLADANVMSRLGEEAKQGRQVTITNFAASRQATEIAATIGSDIEEPDPRHAARWGSKIGGKQVLLRSGVPVAPGHPDLLTDEAAVTAAARHLITTGDPAARQVRQVRQVIVKLQDASWGSAMGNAVLDGERLRTGTLRDAVELIHQPVDEFIHQVRHGGAIVEEYLPDISSSPSGVGRITDDGAVIVLATHDQTLVLGDYTGARYPAAQPWHSQIVRSVQQVGHTLAGLGVRGTYGVDFVASVTRGLHAVEINLRKVGPSHTVNYVESVAGPLPHRRPPGRHHPPLHYLYRRVLQPDVLRRSSVRAIVDRLREAHLLFHHDRGDGVILHMLGALSTCGFIELTSIAASPEAAAAIDESAVAVVLHDPRR